jgi:acyl-CoA-dependent ceramide synthase
MCVWAYLRHYLNLKILYSILTTFKTVGPFELNWETQQYKCWIAQYITFALLASLQAVNLFWFFLICRIAVRFILYKTADDDRSEYEPSEEETEQRERELREEIGETADAAEGVLAAASAREKEGVKLRNGKATSS